MFGQGCLLGWRPRLRSGWLAVDVADPSHDGAPVVLDVVPSRDVSVFDNITRHDDRAGWRFAAEHLHGHELRRSRRRLWDGYVGEDCDRGVRDSAVDGPGSLKQLL